jgi:predicted  nucleic acid-binding Zn-ribbon protein
MGMAGTNWGGGRKRTLFNPLLRILVSLLFLGTQAPLRADTVTLNSGEVLEGQILSETDTQIEMEVSFYHGTIFSTRDVLKTDIKSIVRESVEQKQEKVAYAALAKYTLDPNQELTKEQYATGIDAFVKFLGTYTNSSATAEIKGRVAEWQAEAAYVASGKVKFADMWMTPEEKKPRAERAQRQADLVVAQTGLESLKKQLAELQTQRATLAANAVATQDKLKSAQARLAALQGGAGSTSDSGGRRDLAGRLTEKAVASAQSEGSEPTGPSPETAQLQTEIASYQQQMNQVQGSLAPFDTKIKDIQSQIPPREQDVKSALARLSEGSTPSKTGSVQNASAKESAAPPPPEPTPPWYMRMWKWVHSW